MTSGNGDEIAITNNGCPASRPTPYRTKPATLFGIDRGRIEVLGDIGEPIDVRWEADADGGTGDLP